MKFLIDAHLPPTLCRVLCRAGHDAIQTSGLPDGGLTTDAAISEVAARESRVVISKDTDFYYSHVLRGMPPHLILVRTGNIGVRELCSLISLHLPAILKELETSTLLELDRTSVRAIR